MPPVDPQEVKDRIYSIQSHHYAEFDAALTNAAKNARSLPFNVTPPRNVPYDVRLAVIADWNKAGWKVEWHDDQREGTWVTVSC